ncbi:MAG: hypothetical protein SFX72_09085 [Isosphaeraceae bacterium]|nr:hypothetical protein [Isosphaeraceae bacterium]
MSLSDKQSELEALRARVRSLEAELAAEAGPASPEISRDYPAYIATAGFMLGIFGAAASLAFNVVGSIVAGKPALELIRLYLTFPLGARALELTPPGGPQGYVVGDSLVIALGCCLYLGTGMLLGVPVALAINRFAPRGSLAQRLIICGIAALAIWAIAFYGVLSWLQPMLFGGNWIVDNARLPWWVAAATHVVFGWTIALLYPLVRPESAEAPRPA